MPAVPFYIGSYSISSPWAGAPHAHGAGVLRAELDVETGAVVLGSTQPEINPSFLVRNGEAGRLWAITELEFGGDVVCYRDDGGVGLERIGRLATGADAPCHLAVDWDRRLGFVAHYHGGSVAVLSLDDSGRPLARLTVVRPPGNARGAERGGLRPRPHASLRLENDELLVADTGKDLVLLYRIAGGSSPGRLELLDALSLPAGSGPRHMARLGGRSVVYLSNQSAGGVSVIAHMTTAQGPRLELRSIVAPAGLGHERPVPSEIAVHPAFDIVYMANRRDNSLSVFSIESERGELMYLASFDVMGRNPRHFAISPDGRWLIVANQDSDDLAVFRICNRGGLEWTGRRHSVATPTAICF